MPIKAAIPDEERQLMCKAAQQTRDKNYARRLIAMFMLHRGMTVTEVARLLCAARSSVRRWVNWFTLQGVEGLKSLRPCRAPCWPVADIQRVLASLAGSTFAEGFRPAALPLEHGVTDPYRQPAF